jgi:hypothetical protein
MLRPAGTPAPAGAVGSLPTARPENRWSANDGQAARQSCAMERQNHPNFDGRSSESAVNRTWLGRPASGLPPSNERFGFSSSRWPDRSDPSKSTGRASGRRNGSPGSRRGQCRFGRCQAGKAWRYGRRFPWKEQGELRRATALLAVAARVAQRNSPQGTKVRLCVRKPHRRRISKEQGVGSDPSEIWQTHQLPHGQIGLASRGSWV